MLREVLTVSALILAVLLVRAIFKNLSLIHISEPTRH